MAEGALETGEDGPARKKRKSDVGTLIGGGEWEGIVTETGEEGPGVEP